MLPFVIVGLVSGSVYGLIGLSLVLTYRTSGVFNFAHGALATVAAYIYYVLKVRDGVPTWAALAVTLLVVAPLMGVVLERGASRIANAPLALQIAATIGLLLVVEALANLIFGPGNRTFPSFLPIGTFKLGSVYIGWDQATIFAISLACAIVLYAFLRWRRTGWAMLAVVDNPDLLALAGTSPSRVRRWAWTISCFLVSLSGLLLAPSVGLSPTNLTSLVILGFGAAAVGAFTNIYLAWFGGLAIGVGASLITKYVSATSVLGGLAASLPFLVLFVVILTLPRRRLVAGRPARVRNLNPPWTLPGSFQLGLALVTMLFLCSVPAWAGFRVNSWSLALATAIVLLSLGLLVRNSGQVSLCQITFAAIGAVAFSKLRVNLDIPWIVAMPIAGLIAVPIGALLAIPAIRLSGLYLALATFGFGLLVENMFYQTNIMFGATGLGVSVPSPTFAFLGLNSVKSLYYLILVVAVIMTGVTVTLTRTRLGRLLRAMSDSPVGLETQGASVTLARVGVFCTAAFIAAVGGVLIAMTQQEVSGPSFDPNTSLLWLALIIITVGGTPWYALIAAVGVSLVPTYVGGGNINYYLQLVFGVAAIQVAIAPVSHLTLKWRRVFDRVGRRGAIAARFRSKEAESGPVHPLTAKQTLLEVKHLSVRFGGLRVVQNLNLVCSTGRVTGLIGPNGAGKTTTFNVCSGLLRPAEGRISLGGRDLAGLGPSRRARLGIGRTFQMMELFDSMTVSQNVAMGREASFAGASVLSLAIARRSERSELSRRAEDAIEMCHLTELSGSTVGDLSTGQRRLVELARCLAGPFDVLLLDEPSSGLDRSESKEFGEILRHVVSERRLGILLVEHDMSLVMDVCDYIYVLDFGQLIFEGAPAQIQSSPVVQAAYLGVGSLPSVGSA
jgi:ABC-type branched-subunit amino acid transport system ATPase component/branched-subunit amino acid ABC-type transport system permease component